METFLISHNRWPVAGSFRISRSALSQIDMVQVTLRKNGFEGRGECRPYQRYGDTVNSVTTQLEQLRDEVINHLNADELTPEKLTQWLPAGPALNAIDCALWDLRAKTQARPVWELLGMPKPRRRQTAYTLSMDSPSKMAQAARKAAQYPILKLKIGDQNSLACVKAVCGARPEARLIVDANEAIAPNDLLQFHAALAGLNIALIEQPLPVGQDGPNSLPSGLPYCADESLHTAADLPALKAAGYSAVNVKLDKCGGISAALNLMQNAKAMGFDVMAGCMVGSSLAMAPMMILESLADYIDLDGPLLLASDCENALLYDGPNINPPQTCLWG
ncbi:MAG: dipeptide epimerase [Litorimonas sp.]